MIRVSAAQFALFKAQQEGRTQTPGKVPASTPRARRRRESMPENILEGQICDFLRLRNWHLIRQQVGTFVPYRMLMGKTAIEGVRPVRIGEKGAADWIAIRPRADGADLFFFEAKAPGKKPRPEQLEWLRKRRAVGFVAEFFDDFDGDFDHSFLPLYLRNFGQENR